MYRFLALVLFLGCSKVVAVEPEPQDPPIQDGPESVLSRIEQALSKHSEPSKEVSIKIDGEIDDRIMAPVKDKIEEFVARGDKKINLEIESNGGSVDTGLRFISFMDNFKRDGVTFTCFVPYKAFSMAAIILENCDSKLASSHSILLFHEVSGGAEGRASDIESQAALIREMNKSLANIAASGMKMPLAKYEKKIAADNWMMNANEALKAKATDSIIDSKVFPPNVELPKPADDPMEELKKLLGP